jgi:hypothetical protein
VTGPPRDWDKELADIDRIMAKQSAGGAAPQPGGGPQRAAPALPGAPAVRRRSVALTWFWVLLAIALAAALPLWPYEKSCGIRMAFFLGATGMTAVVGILGAAASWAHRRGFAHLLSLLVVAWALAIGAGEVLPRIGYGREVRSWTCPAALTLKSDDQFNPYSLLHGQDVPEFHQR